MRGNFSSQISHQGVRGRSPRGTNVRRLISGSLLASLRFLHFSFKLRALRLIEARFEKIQTQAGEVVNRDKFEQQLLLLCLSQPLEGK
jgi:hypothetical protein